jgi:hypothetical protein
MKIYELLDERTRRLYMHVEDIVSDYKIEDISLETAVNEIIIRAIEYKNEKEKEAYNRGED